MKDVSTLLEGAQIDSTGCARFGRLTMHVRAASVVAPPAQPEQPGALPEGVEIEVI